MEEQTSETSDPPHPEDLTPDPEISNSQADPTSILSPDRISEARARNRSPSPPRMLFRSTTGKGVAFTTADVTFLIRYLEYCR